MLFGFLAFKLLFLSRVNTLVDQAIAFRMLDLHAERIADIALAPPDAAPLTGYAAPEHVALVLQARGVGFAYGPEGPVFKGVDLDIQPGETVAIVGPSGCGKSTLVKVLVGLLDRGTGEIRANGRDIRDWDRAALRRRIGVVMADDQLFVGTIADNISFFDPHYQPDLIRHCAKLAGIDADIIALPMQYNTLVGSIGTTVSGGQKQRILLARALYRRPEVLFLDEAFDQLDLALEREVTERLRANGFGLVIVSHRPQSVQQADRVVRLGGSSALPQAAAQPTAAAAVNRGSGLPGLAGAAAGDPRTLQ
jgi:ATP-binding cassette subfamily B protein RaxB